MDSQRAEKMGSRMRSVHRSSRLVDSFLSGVALALLLGASARACPTDAEPRAAGTVLTVQLPGQKPQSLGLAALAAWPQTTLTQRQSVASSGSGTTDRAVMYSGVLLRDVLTASGFASATDRSARTSIVEAVASDGYRAVLSWGELFNSRRHLGAGRETPGRGRRSVGAALPGRLAPGSKTCAQSLRAGRAGSLT